MIEPLAIPPDSLVPDPDTGSSNEVEYDLYFRLVREDPGLLAWTRSCLRIDGELVYDAPLVLATAANGRYFGGGMQVAPEARADDGGGE